MRRIMVTGLLLCAAAAGCDHKSQAKSDGGQQPARAAIPSAPDALPAAQTGGFDGAKAYEHVARIVEAGPRPPGSEGSRKAQGYIGSQLQSAGCTVETDVFETPTPQGRVKMTNMVGSSPGSSEKIVLLLSHYDTKQIAEAPNFVGANDGGSSTGVLLELSRLLCRSEARAKLGVWFAFVDGEESYGEWSETDGTYGSRQLAAKLALSGELKRVQAVILVDIVGDKRLQFKREGNSTPWLVDLMWETAHRLGYGDMFLDEESPIEDDHLPFLKRKVPAVDLIHNDYVGRLPWHSGGDTLDRISARSLGITGHVVLETIAALEKKFKQEGKARK